MTDPRKYLLRMLFFIIVVGTIISILNEPLINAFQATTFALHSTFAVPRALDGVGEEAERNFSAEQAGRD